MINQEANKSKLLLIQQIFDENLTCPICYEQFNLLLFKPIIICLNQHSICQVCLKKFLLKNQKCLVCRQTILNNTYLKRNRILCEVIKKKAKFKNHQFTQNNQYSYVGSIIDEKPEGQGCKMINKTQYRGKYKRGELTGQCTVINASGFKFEGLAQDGLLKGKLDMKDSLLNGLFDIQTLKPIQGTKTFKDGSIYEGAFRDFQAQGKGKMKFKNGNVFEGLFAHDCIKNRQKALLSGKFQILIEGKSIRIPKMQKYLQNQSQIMPIVIDASRISINQQ